MVGVVVLAVAGGTALFLTRARGTPPLPKPLGSTAAQAAAPSTTMITLKVTPASPVDPIITETLTATVSPATAAGVVQFTDGSAALDDPVAVIDGSAST
ncbi:MAG: Ig-like domain repeat protein, partial [Pseudonocardiales bacterium]|nr:Ig-like domain repeat protein [Pseudonocardiales bacterium]